MSFGSRRGRLSCRGFNGRIPLSVKYFVSERFVSLGEGNSRGQWGSCRPDPVLSMYLTI